MKNPYMRTIIGSSGRDCVLIILLELCGPKVRLFEGNFSGWINILKVTKKAFSLQTVYFWNIFLGFWCGFLFLNETSILTFAELEIFHSILYNKMNLEKTPVICFLVFAHICNVHQNFVTLRDHIQRFYGNCRQTLFSLFYNINKVFIRIK